ncbi:MAG: site-2 protease family protein [Deltaproteobacteria bacterium]|nr:site-2 protease family protein [Deltaproteobacteria bacterium]
MTAILAFLFVFTSAILVHELGHYLAAKRLGIKVYEFSIGFPFSPKIATLFRHKETEFTLRLLPLGGFVSFSNSGDKDPSQFLRTDRWKRTVISSAGPAFNIAFAFLILTPVFFFGKGLPIYNSILLSASSIVDGFYGMFNLLVSFISGTGSMSQLSGPIGIAHIAGKAAKAGIFDLLYFTGMLSLSLGIFNLLPLPVLDGGHLVIISIESIKRRPMTEKAYELIGIAGIAFFLVLTAVVSYRDVLKLVY